MAGTSESKIVSAGNWAATIGGIAGLIGLFVPFGKDFFLANPLWGWAGLTVLLILVPQYVRWSVQARVKSEEVEFSSRAKDLALLQDRIQGWELHSDFDVLLTRNINHKFLPWSFVSNLENRVFNWDRDTREIIDKRVSKVFVSCHDAAKEYIAKIDEYMWERDATEAARKRMKNGEEVEQYLEVPTEWKHNDVKRYRAAFEELEACRSLFAASLGEVYKILHTGSLAS